MLTDLANVCRSSGLTVIEVAGWQSRGYAGQSLAAVNGVLFHHTATASCRNYTSGAPTLGMLRDGRSDLPGPLCNLALGRGGEVYVVAAGVANHAGQGSAPGFPTDMGNHYLIGIEMESSGVAPWDWTPAQLDAAPRLGAALERAYLQWLAPDMRLQLAHYEYSSAGKIDPAGWPGGMDGLRASINAILAGPQAAVGPASNTTVTPIQEDDMPLSDADVEKVAKRAAELTWLYDYKVSGRPGKPLWILQSLDGIVGDVVKRTIDGVTAPILKAVAAVPGVDPETVKAALQDAAAQIKVSIDTQAIAQQAADELGKRVSNG